VTVLLGLQIKKAESLF